MDHDLPWSGDGEPVEARLAEPAARGAGTRAVSLPAGRPLLAPALALAGLALFASSYFLPWWNFQLVAPQYPKGLHLAISLTGVTGDVAEIDIINHYIGMRSMSSAAELERGLAAWLVGGLSGTAAALLAVGGRRLRWLALAAMATLPVGFVADTTWWMYRFGHELDPRAPMDFAPFMPTLLGRGDIGQFHTLAAPAIGFWASWVGIALVVASIVASRRGAP